MEEIKLTPETKSSAYHLYCGDETCRNTITKLKRENTELFADRIMDGIKLAARIQELEAKLAAAEADTKRLDWLEKETANAIYDTQSYTYKVTFRVGQGAFVSDCGSLRGAIDAAKTGV